MSIPRLHPQKEEQDGVADGTTAWIKYRLAIAERYEGCKINEWRG